MTDITASHSSSIHPLAIAGMCDHFTRAAWPPTQSEGQRKYFIGGLLFGTSSAGLGKEPPSLCSTSLQILDAVEIVSLALDAHGSSTINPAEINLRLKLQGVGDPSASAYAPGRRALGWYVFMERTATDEQNPIAVAPEHATIHESLVGLTGCQDLVVLVLDPRPLPSSHQLPFACYFRAIQRPDLFIEVSKCNVMSSDAERVVLSQIAVPSFGKSDEDVLMTAEASELIKSAAATQSASLAALVDRIDKIEVALAKMQKDSVIDYDFLRDVGKIHKSLKLARQQFDCNTGTTSSHLPPTLISHLAKLFSDTSNLQKKYLMSFGFSVQQSD